MLTFLHCSSYDLLLILVVTLMGTGVAYMKNPFWKSFILLLPFPSSLAILTLGKPIDASAVLGILLLLTYFRIVELLYNRCRVNIFLAIGIAVAVFCTLGSLINPWIRHDSVFFWSVWGVVISVCVAVYGLTKIPEETGVRTSFPLYLKIPILLIVCFFVVKVKTLLGGFIVMFPMVGVVGAYESRSCLKTVFRQVSLLGITFCPLAAVCFLLQKRLGVLAALGLGWCAYLLMLFLLRHYWFPQVVEQDAKSRPARFLFSLFHG